MGVGTVLIVYLAVFVGVFACGVFMLKYARNINFATNKKAKVITISAGYLFPILLLFLPFGFWSMVVGLLGLLISRLNLEIGNTRHGLYQILLLVIAIMVNAILIAIK